MNEEQVKVVEVEIAKVNLQPGDVMMVTIKSGASSDALAYLNQRLQEFFPNNKIVVFGMGIGESVDFAVANQDQAEYTETEEKTEVLETTGETDGRPQDAP